jgi:hypothetical protein
MLKCKIYTYICCNLTEFAPAAEDFLTNEVSHHEPETILVVHVPVDYGNIRCIVSGDNRRFQHLTTEQGLSQNTIDSILCDSKGFMWFGTWDMEHAHASHTSKDGK